MAAVSWNKKRKQWEARIQRDGVRRRFYSDRPGIRGKNDVLQQIRDFENGLLPSDLTVGELWTPFMEDVRQRASAANLRNVEGTGRLYILPTMSGRILSDLSINDWQLVINNATGRDGKELSEKTLKNIRAAISSFMRYCFRAGLVPTAELGLYIPKGHPTYSKVILQPDQIRALFSDDFGDHYINAWRLMLVTGLRPGEALGLQWSDVQDGVIVIRRSINRAGELTSGKNKNANRIIPISNFARTILEDQRARSAPFASPWIFCSVIGEMPCQSSAFKTFKRTVTAIGAPDCSMYSLRHTFVSIMSASVPEAALKKIVGHSATMNTIGVYGHHVSGEEVQLARSLDAALAPLAVPDAPISSRTVKSEELPSERKTVKITPINAQ